MFFNFFKQPITSKELAGTLYVTAVRDLSQEEPRKDINGKELFSKEERKFILLAHLYQLFGAKGLEKAQMNLILFCDREHFKVQTQDELAERIIDIAIKIEEINNYFNNLPPMHEFYKKKFLFGKKLDLMQRPLALQACVLDKQMLDSVFDATMKKFKITDA